MKLDSKRKLTSNKILYLKYENVNVTCTISSMTMLVWVWSTHATHTGNQIIWGKNEWCWSYTHVSKPQSPTNWSTNLTNNLSQRALRGQPMNKRSQAWTRLKLRTDHNLSSLESQQPHAAEEDNSSAWLAQGTCTHTNSHDSNKHSVRCLVLVIEW